MVIECPLPLWLSSGATTITSPSAFSDWASARIPGARTPSSLLTRMRYVDGWGATLVTGASTARTISATRTPSFRMLRSLAQVESEDLDDFGRTPGRGSIDGPRDEAEQNHGQERHQQGEERRENGAGNRNDEDDRNDRHQYQSDRYAEDAEYELEEETNRKEHRPEENLHDEGDGGHREERDHNDRAQHEEDEHVIEIYARRPPEVPASGAGPRARAGRSGAGIPAWSPVVHRDFARSAFRRRSREASENSGARRTRRTGPVERPSSQSIPSRSP